MAIVKVQQVAKQIKSKRILTGIDFTIESGECVALIGPNGAGKTTLMELLLHDKKVSQGTIELLGHPVQSAKLKQLVGVLPQQNALPKKMKVKELLQFFCSLYSNPLSTAEIQAILQFDDKQMEQLTEKLSGGQRRLLAFVIALVGRPQLLLLDEPTAAMDTSTRQRFWEVIGELKAQGMTIIYSSHYIEEVEHTADRILVLHQGKLIRDTTPHKMRSEEQTQFFTVPLTYQALVESWVAGARVLNVAVQRDNIAFETRQGAWVWQQLSQAGCRFEDIEVTHRTLLNSIFETTKEEN